mmetsp:Transcript_12791/g.41814  ORF Transcript_12791/g.41814 Transcript_12791/m.41814 type:complete len:133 (-) Transcript_12791:2032-2430(-)
MAGGSGVSARRRREGGTFRLWGGVEAGVRLVGLWWGDRGPGKHGRASGEPAVGEGEAALRGSSGDRGETERGEVRGERVLTRGGPAWAAAAAQAAAAAAAEGKRGSRSVWEECRREDGVSFRPRSSQPASLT